MKNTRFFAYVVIISATLLAISSSWNDSLIVDEVPHIGAGYSYITAQDMRLNPEHPPLVKDLAGIPLAFMHLNQDVYKTKQWTTDTNGQWEFGRKLIYDSGNDADNVKHAARLPVLLFFILSAWLIFTWAESLYGDTGAIIALLVFSLSPTILAHSRFVTTDVAAAWAVLYATYFFLKYLHHPTKKNMLIAAGVLGLAFLTKFSTFLLVPFLGLLAMVWGFINGHYLEDRFKDAFNQGLKATLVIAIAFVAVVWPLYAIQSIHYSAEQEKMDTTQILSSFKNRPLANIVIWFSDKPVIRYLDHYALGLLMVGQRAVGGNTVFFLGNITVDGSRFYFPVMYFLKEPLAWWILALMAVIIIPLQLRGAHFKFKRLVSWLRTHFPEFAMMLWLFIYWAVSIKSTLNIGIRHIIPTYPFAIILVAGQIAYISDWVRSIGHKEFKNFSILIALLLGWYAFENVHTYPYYLTYYNEVAGGPSGGYQYAVDSNLDWGQDIIRLAQFVDTNNIKKMEVDYFGWADATYYMRDHFVWTTSSKYADAKDFLKNNHTDGWIAVSATFLQNSPGTAEEPAKRNWTWLKAYQPEAVIGHSIFVWHITHL